MGRKAEGSNKTAGDMFLKNTMGTLSTIFVGRIL